MRRRPKSKLLLAIVSFSFYFVQLPIEVEAHNYPATNGKGFYIVNDTRHLVSVPPVLE